MVVEEIVGVILKKSEVARLHEGVETKPTKMGDRLIKIVLKLVEVAVRVVIGNNFILFWLIPKWKLLRPG